MLPGFVAGHYSFDEVHIDLQRLSRFAQCRLIHAEAIKLDTRVNSHNPLITQMSQKRQVFLKDRPPMTYDVLSIDIGSSPDVDSIPGARQFTTPVKPISTFCQRLEDLLNRMKRPPSAISRRTSTSSDGSQTEIRLEINRRSSLKRALGDRGFCVVVVGGGAGGVELAFAIKQRLMDEAQKTSKTFMSEPVVKSSLFTIVISCILCRLVAKGQLLEGYNGLARDAILKKFAEKGIELIQNNPVIEVHESRKTPSPSLLQSHSDCLRLKHGQLIMFDGCLWCTQASAVPWLSLDSKLLLDERGFIKINDFLQPFNGPAGVFAVGDIATSASHPRPKAGVFAVRQVGFERYAFEHNLFKGPPLDTNIRRYLRGEELLPYYPQSSFLSLISTGDKYCVASKGLLFWKGNSKA